MSVSQYGLDKVLGDRLDRIEMEMRGINRNLARIGATMEWLAKISENIDWIASCHYQHFSPATTTSTKATPAQAIKGTGRVLDSDPLF